MILSCILRIRQRTGYYVGKTLVTQTLQGSKNRRVLDMGLDELSTYGLLPKTSAREDTVRSSFWSRRAPAHQSGASDLGAIPDRFRHPL
ncbi:MAG: RQC domain-containing protein [Oscillospiraceae bacterium]